MFSFFSNINEYIINLSIPCLMGVTFYGTLSIFYPNELNFLKLLIIKETKKNTLYFLKKSNIMKNILWCREYQSFNAQRIEPCKTKKEKIKLKKTNNIVLEIKETEYGLISFNAKNNSQIILNNASINNIVAFLETPHKKDHVLKNIEHFDLFLLKKKINDSFYYKNITECIKNRKINEKINLDSFQFNIVDNPMKSITISFNNLHLDIDNDDGIVPFCIENNDIFCKHFIKWYMLFREKIEWSSNQKYKISCIDSNIDIFVIDNSKKIIINKNGTVEVKNMLKC